MNNLSPTSNRCLICKLLMYQEIAENALTIAGQHSQSKVAFYKKLTEQTRLRVVNLRSKKTLHLCSEVHSQIASTLRTGHRKLRQEAIAKQRFHVQSALESYKQWLLKVGELKVKRSSHITQSNSLRSTEPISEGEKKNIFDIELARAEAMASHYRTLHSQRLRRLKEMEALKH